MRRPPSPSASTQVAQTAGVARSTVYLIFGSRAGLFDAVTADLLERGGIQRVLDAVAASRPARAPPRRNPRRRAHTSPPIATCFRALISMAALDPEAVGGAMQRSEEHRAKRNDA